MISCKGFVTMGASEYISGKEVCCLLERDRGPLLKAESLGSLGVQCSQACTQMSPSQLSGPQFFSNKALTWA